MSTTKREAPNVHFRVIKMDIGRDEARDFLFRLLPNGESGMLIAMLIEALITIQRKRKVMKDLDPEQYAQGTKFLNEAVVVYSKFTALFEDDTRKEFLKHLKQMTGIEIQTMDMSKHAEEESL